MALPSTVTKRAQSNDFIASTGITLTGVTGFSVSTGFYLTNSGSNGISTSLSFDEAYVGEGMFGFPSGKKFSIQAGTSKFIPFEMAFLQDNYASGPDQTSTGPDGNGLWTTQFNLSTISEETAVSDPSGDIRIFVTGKVTGFQGGSGPFTSSAPAHPSGFLVTTDYGIKGKPETVLRWQHPSTGYYLTKYEIEYAGNLDSSSSPTGNWTGLATFDINRSLNTFSSPQVTTDFQYYKYATNSGISQLHTRGTANNPATPYGEYKAENLGFSADYYFRIKSVYDLSNIPGGATVESQYIYGYPVDNFNVEITDNNINGGLLSGSSTLPAGASNSPTVIANSAGAPRPLNIYYPEGTANINLKTSFDNKLTDITGSVNMFDPTHADYGFSGVHFIVPEDATVGSNNSSNAGIDTGSRLLYGSTEIKSNLILERNSRVLGMGGQGGNAGFTSIEMLEDAPSATRQGKIQIKNRETTDSGDGGNGSAAIYISDSAIQELRIKKHPTAKIYGGGGGGGGGDPFFWPKAFNLNPSFLANINKGIEEIQALIDSLNGINRQDAPETGNTSQNSPVKLEIKEGGVISINSIDYTTKDIYGTQLAGRGGGGQGFGISLGGRDLRYTAEPFTNKGSRDFAGMGSFPSATLKLSAGGSGGAFGEDGETPQDVNANEVYQLTSAEQPKPANGGAAGEAIKIIDSNNNYSGFRSLVQSRGIKDINTTNFPNLVAWFSTSDISATYFDTTTVDSYKQINQWKAKNDTDIYIQFAAETNTSKPLLIENGVTTNSACYTTPFGGADVVFFGGRHGGGNGKFTGGKIKNIIGSDKINDELDGFEIVYIVYPGTVKVGNAKALQSQFNPFYLDSGAGYKQGDFKPENNALRKSSGSLNFPLHQWNKNTVTFGDQSYAAQESFFYKSLKGAPITSASSLFFPESTERAGLSQNRGLTFFHHLPNSLNPDKPNPEKSWMYSISSFKKLGKTYYNIYNNLNLRKSTFYNDVQNYEFPAEPRLGYSNKSFEYNSSFNSHFYGCITDIVVLKKDLADFEREALFANFMDSSLNIKNSANSNDENDRNVVNDGNGYAGFNIGPDW